jgi:hypothetical protein
MGMCETMGKDTGLDWQLVEIKNPSGATSQTFSNIDGVFDYEYLLRGYYTMTSYASNRPIYLQLNNDTTTDLTYTAHTVGSASGTPHDGGETHATSGYILPVGIAEANYTLQGWFQCKLNGFYDVDSHIFRGEYVNHNSNNYRKLTNFEGHWRSPTKITQLSVRTANGTYSGHLELYRRRGW